MTIFTSGFFAPVCLVISYLLSDILGYKCGIGIAYVFAFIFAAAGLLSAVVFFSDKNKSKVLKYAVIGLCAFMALSTGIDSSRFFNGTDTAQATEERTASGGYGSGYSSGYSYSNYSGYSDHSYNSGSSGYTSDDETCRTCYGSGKCHICNDKPIPCHVGCRYGDCTNCYGTGINSRGYSCTTCSGSGTCRFCGGDGYATCTLCHGRGGCDYCGGDGKR